MRYRKGRITIQPGKRVLILCEGETEENYFEGLKTYDNFRGTLHGLKAEKPSRHTPKQLLEIAKQRIKDADREGNSYSSVWLVFDGDRNHIGIPEVFNEVRSYPKIRIAYTAPCFEYFVLLHFRRTTRSFQDCDEVGRILRDIWFDYEKASTYEYLYEQLETAIANSEWCCHQAQSDLDCGRNTYEITAYCNMHELLKYLKAMRDEYYNTGQASNS